MRTFALIVLNIFLLTTFVVYSQSTAQLIRQPLFHEPFIDNSNQWLGIGINDQLGSAKIVENNYCEVIAPRDSSMIIANEQNIDANRDFEISCCIRINYQNAKALNSLFSISWGCSFENMSQYSFSLAPSKQVMVRRFNETVQDIVVPQIVTGIDPKELNVITIRKKDNRYSFYINHQQIGSAPFENLFGGGIIMTVGSGLTVLVDYLSMDYLVAETKTTGLPRIVLDAPFSSTDKAETQEADFLISGYSIDNDGIAKMEINGLNVDLVNGLFRYRAQLMAGNNMFKLEITNQLGQKQIKYIEIIRHEPPEKLVVGQKRLALVIGNSKYQYSSELKNPSRDAADMAELLKGMGFEVMYRTDLDYQALINTLKEFGRNINQYDVTLVFYAGHGIQVDGKNYMLPVNAQLKNKSDVAFEAIDVERVVDILSETDDNNLNLLILDACRNNPFRSWSRGGPDGLASIHPPSGVIVAFSTSPGSFASDGIGENGLYTEELMNQLKVSQRVEDIFINTRIAVERRSNGTQSPWELARLRGKYYLK